MPGLAWNSLIIDHTKVLISDNIQWYLSGVDANPALAILFEIKERRDKYTEDKISETCVVALETATNFKFKPRGAEEARRLHYELDCAVRGCSLLLCRLRSGHVRFAF
jgi:hypothetical protein